MVDPKIDPNKEYLEKQHEIAQLEIKKLINLMGADKFGKFAILVLRYWLPHMEITLKLLEKSIKETPKYFMLAVRAYVSGIGEEKANEMFSVSFDDVMPGIE